MREGGTELSVINKMINITINKLEYCPTSMIHYTLAEVAVDLAISIFYSTTLRTRTWPASLRDFEFSPIVSCKGSNRPSLGICSPLRG